MLDPGPLLSYFLYEVLDYLTRDGIMLMPYYHLAERLNNPAIRALQLGYEFEVKTQIEINEGLQKGEISIYELRKPDSITISEAMV